MAIFITYLIIFGSLFVFGVPVALALSGAALLMTYISGIDIMVFAQKFMVSMDNYSLTAMFFFMLAGEIMNGGGITKRIIAFVSKIVKNMAGGLGIVTMLSCAIFAAINGSSIATAIAVGSIMYPAMVKQGYDKVFAAAIVVSGGIIGPIIPPSIPMIVYASITGDSVAALFTGGIILGILITLSFCVLIYFISKKKGYGVNVKEDIDFGKTKGIIWALLFPILILGSIVSGLMTTTETSSLSVVYAYVVGAFVYKEFKIKEFPQMIMRSMKSSGTVMAIVCSATAVAFVLTYNRVPQEITEFLISNIETPTGFIFATFLMLLIVGMIMDLTPAILILTPIFMSPILTFSVDPIFFGVIFCATLTAGLITPPVGTLIYLGCSMSGESFSKMVNRLKPFIIVVYIVLVFTLLFPSIVTFIPQYILNF